MTWFAFFIGVLIGGVLGMALSAWLMYRSLTRGG